MNLIERTRKTNILRELSAAAASLGQTYNVSFTLNLEINDEMNEYALLMTTFLPYNELMSIERYRGKWGLYYTYLPKGCPLPELFRKIPLLEAPEKSQERALLRAEEFFKKYKKLVDERERQQQTLHLAGTRALETIRSWENPMTNELSQIKSQLLSELEKRGGSMTILVGGAGQAGRENFVRFQALEELEAEGKVLINRSIPLDEQGNPRVVAYLHHKPLAA